MPARVNKIRHDENTRAKIRVAHLLNTLDAHVDGKRALEPSQLKAIEILLSKSLPSLQSVEISGEISSTNVVRAPAIATGSTDWQSQHVPIALRPTEH